MLYEIRVNHEYSDIGFPTSDTQVLPDIVFLVLTINSDRLLKNQHYLLWR
jgi:hypothetical protein